MARGTNGERRPTPVYYVLPRGEPDSEPTTAGGAELSSWIRASLLGIAWGLGIAKYGQASAGHTLHPAAAMGSIIVLASVALTVVAHFRYLRGARAGAVARSAPGKRAVDVLAGMGLALVILVAWAALAMIWFAGPQLPWGANGAGGE
jgi:uncharacterized membrane protein YidH (DUF202 family)